MEARRPSGRRLRRCGDRKAWQSGVSKPLFCRSLESLRVLPLTRRLLPPLTTRPEVNSFDRFGSSDRWPEGGDRIECEGGRCRCFAGRATRPKGRFLVLPAFRHDHLADAPRPEAVDICSYDRVCMTRRWSGMDSNFQFRARRHDLEHASIGHFVLRREWFRDSIHSPCFCARPRSTIRDSHP